MIYESAFKNKTSEPVIRNNSRFDKFVSDSQYTFLIEQLSTLIWRKGLIDYPHFLKIEEFKEHANKHLKENEKKEATNNFLYALHIIFILIIVSIFPLLKYLK